MRKIWKSLSYASSYPSCKCNPPIKPRHAEKMTLAVLAAKLKEFTQRPTSQLQDVIRIFKPETILRWYGELVRRKWGTANSWLSSLHRDICR
jgi:hypothetical protein